MSVTHSLERSTLAMASERAGGIAAGENIFPHPWAGCTGAAFAADGMQKRHAIRLQQIAHLG